MPSGGTVSGGAWEPTLAPARGDGRRSDTRLLVVPVWVATLLLAAPPLLWLRARRRRAATPGRTAAV